MISLSRLAVVLVAASCASSGSPATVPVGVSTIQQAVVVREPLATWSPGPTKQAIVDFVTHVSAPGSPGIVPIEERIAVFDDDGTLWPEKPLVDAAFVVARLKAEVVEQPRLGDREPYHSVLSQGADGLSSLGKDAVLEAIARTHSGRTDEELEAEARRFLANASHPTFRAPYPALVYRPMRELLAYLREHGFSIYLCTGSDESFARVLAAQVYDLPRDRVVGSSLRKELVVDKDRAVLKRLPEVLSFNDADEMVVNLSRRLGRRPLVAVGRVRAGGDVAMLTYSRMRGGPALALVVNHDDPARELAYTERDGATLNAARERGFTVVSMKQDWAEIFDAPRP